MRGVEHEVTHTTQVEEPVTGTQVSGNTVRYYHKHGGESVTAVVE